MFMEILISLFRDRTCELLDCSQLNDPDSLLRVALFVPEEEANNRFRLTFRAAKERVRERKVIPMCVIDSKYDISDYIKMSDRFDIDVTFLEIRNSYATRLLELPFMVTVALKLSCYDFDPRLLEFIHPQIRQLKIVSAIMDCLPINLKDVLDRLDAISYLYLSPANFQDGADWVHILLRWLISRGPEKKVDCLILMVEHSSADDDLDELLTVVKNYVRGFGIFLLWKGEESNAVKKKFPFINFNCMPSMDEYPLTG